MSDHGAAALIELFAAIHNQQNVEAASNLLAEAYQRKETLGSLLAILANPCEEYLRCSVALALRQIFRRGSFDESQLPHVKTALVDAIRREDSEYVRRLLGDTAIEFLRKTSRFDWPEFYELVAAMLGEAKTVETGLFLWIGIAEVVPEMGILQYFERLVEAVVAAMSGATVESRVYAIQLFDMLASKVSSKLFDDYTQIPELFLSEAAAVVSKRVSEEGLANCQREAGALFECVAAQLTNEMGVFMKYGEPFVKLALDLTLSDADPSLRAACQGILAVAPQIFPDLVTDQLPYFLNSVLQLAVVICEQDRSGGEIQFVGTFTDSVASNTEAGIDLLQLLMTFASQAFEKKSGAALQVAIIALAACLSSTRDEMAEDSDQVMMLVVQAMQLDKDLFDAGCAFLLEASSVCPDIMLCCFNDIVGLLFKHISESRALQTLDFVMYSVDVAPDNYKELLAALTTLLNHCSKDRYDCIVSCMTSAISSVDEVNNDIYANLRGVLTGLLQSDSAARAKVFEFFGFMAKIAPQAIQTDMPELMKVLFSSLSDEDANMNENIAVCITNVAKVLPLAVQPFVSQILPPFLQILEKEVPSLNTTEEEEEDESSIGTVVAGMQAAVLNTIATLITELPQDMAPFAEQCVTVISKFLDKPQTSLQTAAAKSILLMNDGLRALNFQGAQGLFSSIVESIHDVSDVKLAGELFFALGSVLVTFGNAFSAEEIEKCMELFGQCFSGKIEVLYSGKALAVDILDSLFFAVRMFIFGLGENFVHVAERFLEFLRPHVNSKKRTTQAYIIHTLGAISLICPACNQCAKLAIEMCSKCLTKKTNSVQNVILAGMNYIVISNKDMIPAQTLSQLRQIVQGVIAESASDSAECEMIVGTAATLWCSLAMTCGPQGKNFINDLNTVLALLPPVIDDDDMPFTAQFLCHALQQWPDAVRPHMKRILVNIFASGEWCLKLAPRDAMSTLASLIQQIPEPELLELVKWNQHHLLQITKNIKRYQTQ